MVASAQDQMKDMLERMFVFDVKPSPQQLHELGLDKRYLELIFFKLRNHISSLPSFRSINESLQLKNLKGERASYSEASWADVRCVRIANRKESLLGNMYYEPLVTLYDNSEYTWNAQTSYLEIFVTCNGEWILCNTANIYDENFSPTICRKVDELQEYLSVLGDNYWLYPKADSILVTIANWLMYACRREIDRMKSSVSYFEASISECETLQERFGYATRYR